MYDPCLYIEFKRLEMQKKKKGEGDTSSLTPHLKSSLLLCSLSVGSI